MPKEFIIRGQTASGGTEVLDMTGYRPGYGYRLTEFSLFPSTDIGAVNYEMAGAITAGNAAVSAIDPDFNDEGLIGSSIISDTASREQPSGITHSVINDLFVITQDLILSVRNSDGTNEPINWQVRFKEVKLPGAAEAVANYKQYTIYNTSS